MKKIIFREACAAVFTGKKIPGALTVMLLCLLCLAGQSQIISWDSGNNGGGPNGFGITPWPPAAYNANLTMIGTGLIRGSGILTTNTAAGSSWGGSGGWSATADAGCVYFSFRANAGYQVSLSSITGYLRRSSGGPPSGNLEYSLNGGAYVLAGTWATSSTSTGGALWSLTLSGIAALQNVAAATTIKLRFTFSATSGNWYLTNGATALKLNGAVTAAAPSYFASITRTGIIQCNGNANGALTAGVTGGTSPYTYSWMPSGGTNSVATGLAADTYTCLVTDAAAAVTSATFVLVQPAVLSANTSSLKNVSCFNGANGSATITTSGGTAPYAYLWSSASGTTSAAVNLLPGNYTVSVTDSKLCSTTETLSISQPTAAPSITATVSNSLVCSGSTVALNGLGATTYTWTEGAMDGVAFSPDATTIYSVTGADNNGCLGYAFITVSVNITPTLTVNSGAICPGNPFVLTPGGAATYTFSSGSATVMPTALDTYSVYGTSIDGCEALLPAIATVTVTGSLTVTINGPSAICYGDQANLTANGATSYTWSTSDLTYTIAPSPGVNTTYSVVGASGSCSNSAVITISVNSLPVVSAVGSSVICAGETATFSVTGASTYSWNTNATTSVVAVTPSLTTTYTVVGTDLNGCSNMAIRSVTVNPTPAIAVAGGTVCRGSSFTLSPAGAASYTFSGGAIVSPAVTSNYSVTGTNSFGCVSFTSAVAAVTVYALPSISVNSGSICTGKIFTMTPSGALTYTFSNGSATVIPASNSGYSVTGTNSMGCVSSTAAIANVSLNALPLITANDGTICAGKIFTITPAGALSYTYSGGSSTVNPATSTSYSISGTNSLGCVSATPVVVNVTVNLLPVIAVSGGTVCKGSSFTLSPSGALSYSFSSGTAIVSPSVNTSYSISGTNSSGCVSSGSIATTVSVMALPTVIVNSATICSGNTFTLVPTGASTYTFSGGSAVVTPTGTTSYSVSGTNTAGCISLNPAIATITVIALPGLSVTGASTLCEGSSLNLTANGASTYTWSTSSNIASVLLTPSVSTVYTVAGTQTTGCSNSITYSITVYATPTLTSPNAAICPGDSYTLSPSGASSYTFSGGPVVTPAMTSTYTVTGTSSLGCISLTPAISVITVTNSILVTASGSTLICKGQSSALNATGANTYTWSNGTISPTIAPSPTVNTTYTVTGSSGSCSNTAVISVSLLPTPSVIVVSSRSLICVGETATLSVSGASTYSWIQENSTQTSLVVTLTTNATYTVMGTDAQGCTATGTVTQKVSNCTDINSYEKKQTFLTVFPNPNTGEFIIKGNVPAHLVVIDELGRTVQKIELDGITGEVHVKGLSAGIYFVKDQDARLQVNKKIIVTH